MQILKEKQSLKEQIQAYKNDGLSIGFVPTMGALHQGHISLIQKALSLCDKVVVSIFVNPTQFDNPEDLEKYPRDLEKDVDRIKEISDQVIVFSPAANEIYGSNVTSEEFSFDGLEHQMEGKFRKGHFNGVGTIVKKLFEMVQPDKAFFGEKDYQQLQIIKKLVEKQHLPVEVIGCPIDREISGLARSSRNERLTTEQRQNAAAIYKVLQQVKEDFGTKSASELTDWVRDRFRSESSLELEYFEIANADTLRPVEEKKEGEKYRAFIAAYSGDIRLIDNIALN
ncbi:pantothenate synthetase [Salinimicrobium catena]|uniref:Pantothenate synthetase n=1 Tax=Salinimicrobium catena TaxID=390640 RepID=A0A1H5JC29_9FLAO|nr:pantoate--beta-alanine ligase [Salinimicrobium catena]SDK86218.1 pantoate--beta-alanine ligase [Salinimicrobium catena]SEE49807.1 pantothenate synthetase [Salinimicrobium catena]